jgi:hypothetical protein
MLLLVGDHHTDETGEWEVVSRPVSFRGGKGVRARVQVSGRPDTGRPVGFPLCAGYELVAGAGRRGGGIPAAVPRLPDRGRQYFGKAPGGAVDGAADPGSVGGDADGSVTTSRVRNLLPFCSM